MSELTKMIKVPLWELKEISDTLRDGSKCA